jgi:carboxyl-terminal processing protease
VEPRKLIVRILLCLMLLSLHAYAAEAVKEADAGQTDAGPALATDKPVSTEELARFAEVFRTVQKAFVDPVSEHVLMEAAIHGLLTRLDPHSEYLSKAQLAEFSEDTSGRYAGLGIEVQVVQGSLKIISPMDDTPAARAGLKAGDVIERIDGTLLSGEAAYDGVDMLRGPAGSEIELLIARGAEDPFSVKLKREVIQVKSVTLTALPKDIAVLRVSAFQADTAPTAKRLLTERQAKSPLQGLILDLRSNPGGLVHAAIGISDLFLHSGVIVSTRGRFSDQATQAKATPGDLLLGAPMVVLIDTGSASAAEIVAGALQDQGRAVLVGSTSFGKGSVQQVLPLSNGDAMKLTTARYYTPSGRSIQARGIRPDVELAPYTLQRARDVEPGAQVVEADLPRHLSGEKRESKSVQATLEQDFALHEATQILRAMAVRESQIMRGAGKDDASLSVVTPAKKSDESENNANREMH